MLCRICKKDSVSIFKKLVLNKYNVQYYQCINCNFIQTEEPYWLDEAYQKTINISDTGLLARNIHLSKMTSLLIYFLFDRKGTFLDFAGGYGVFTRLMRDIGLNFLWHDPHTSNLLAQGFEWKINNPARIELLTSFESFEHFIDPIKELQRMANISDNILFSTELIPDNNITEWKYLGPEHGQHVSFYSKKSLQIIAEKFNFNLYSNNSSLHLLTRSKKKVSIDLIYILTKLQLDLLIKLITKSKTVSDSDYLITK